MATEDRRNYGNEQQEQAYIESAKAYVAEHLDPEKTPVTLDDYFLHLLDRGVKTRERGNYGIAAAVIIFDRNQNQVTAIFGENSLMVDRSHRGHAEMNAMENAWQAINNFEERDRLYQQGNIVTWPLNENEATSLENLFPQTSEDGINTAIITSLEPCIMCTGGIINSDIGLVVSAQEDEFAGAMHHDRLSQLPPLWPMMVENKGMNVVFCQSEDEESADYLSTDLRGLLVSLFEDTKKPLDDVLAEESFFIPKHILDQE